MGTTEDFVTSDGARLRFSRRGDGPPLVLLHGGMTDHRCFDPVVDRFAEHFTTFAYDRRGHGMSAHEPLGSLDLDAADLLELAAHIDDGDGVGALGYSFGGLVALTAVTRGGPTPIRSLVVYEPPYPVEGMMTGRADIVAHAEAGRADDAMRVFVSTTFHLPDAVVDLMSTHDMWEVSLGLVQTMPTELRELAGARLPEPGTPSPPTRFLLTEGGGNPAFAAIASELEAAIGSETVGIPGLPHFAISTNPAEFAAAALDHLRAVHPTPD